MTRGRWTTHERSVLALCAVGAVAVAIAYPFPWRWSLDLPSNGSFDPTLWLGTALAAVPSCIALAGRASLRQLDLPQETAGVA